MSTTAVSSPTYRMQPQEAPIAFVSPARKICAFAFAAIAAGGIAASWVTLPPLHAAVVSFGIGSIALLCVSALLTPRSESPHFSPPIVQRRIEEIPVVTTVHHIEPYPIVVQPTVHRWREWNIPLFVPREAPHVRVGRGELYGSQPRRTMEYRTVSAASQPHVRVGGGHRTERPLSSGFSSSSFIGDRVRVGSRRG